MLEAFAQPKFVSWRSDTPPGSPSTGDVHITGPSPTGDWSGQADSLAVYRADTTWDFVALSSLPCLHGVHPSGLPATWNGTQWIYAGHQTLTDAASITWDVSLGASAKVSLTANRTIANPTGLIAGQRLSLVVVQPEGSAATVTWGGSFRWAGGSAATLSTKLGAKDLLEFDVIATNEIVGFLAVADYS